MDKIDKYFNEFLDFLEHNEICKGDIVYVGSDVSGILLGARRELDIKDRPSQNMFLNRLIDTLQIAVGNEGTLLFPNFTWAFCRGEVFDFRKTHGEIGVLNNFILENRKDFLRTRHPIYNFMVWGKNATLLSAIDNQDSWGKDSPFAYLYEHHGKQINLNVPFNKCITFQHYVEQCINAPYRYKKFFMGKYVDENGNELERIYSMFVRDLAISSSPYLPEEFFVDSHAARVDFFHEYKVIFMKLDDIYYCIKNDLLNNKGKHIYHFIDYEPDWNCQNTHRKEIKLNEEMTIEI